MSIAISGREQNNATQQVGNVCEAQFIEGDNQSRQNNQPKGGQFRTVRDITAHHLP